MNRETFNESKLHSLIYFAQCDTTAGLLSHNPQILNICKKRPIEQNVLMQSASLSILKTLVRVPTRHKNRVRKSSLCTFIYPNKKAIRLINDILHKRFFDTFGTLYSTSANPTKQNFDRHYAETICDVIVLDKRGFAQKDVSKIYKINRHKIKRIR